MYTFCITRYSSTSWWQGQDLSLEAPCFSWFLMPQECFHKTTVQWKLQMSGFIGWLGSFLKLMITLWMISLGPYFSYGAFTASMLPKIWADAGRPPCCRALPGRRTQPFGKNLLKARSSVLRLLQLCCGWAVVVSYVGYIILVYVGNMMDRTNVHLPLYHWSVHFPDSLVFLVDTNAYRIDKEITSNQRDTCLQRHFSNIIFRTLSFKFGLSMQQGAAPIIQ